MDPGGLMEEEEEEEAALYIEFYHKSCQEAHFSVNPTPWIGNSLSSKYVPGC